MTTIKLYRNKRNPHKFIEIHNDGHYHNSVRQFMYWTHKKRGVTLSQTKNYTGDGVLHRWRKGNLDALLEDYEHVSVPSLENQMKR